jgi:hypothetical protein
MRAWELLTEGEQPTVESDLEDLLIASKANDLEDVDVEDLVNQLNDMGHSVTQDSLVDMMNNLELDFVDNVTLNTITIKSHTAEPSDEDEGEGDNEFDDSPSSEDLAKKSAMKRVRQRAAQKRKTTKDAQL